MCISVTRFQDLIGRLYEALLSIMAISHCSYCQCECHCQESANSSHAFPNHLQLLFADNNCQFLNPISTGLFYLVVALKGRGGSTPSIKFDPDILEH